MATEPEVKQLLNSLSRAIKGDRRFFVTSKTDPSFDPVRIHVDGLLDQLTQEAKVQAEKEIASAQSAFDEMEDWHAYEAASSEYNSALNTMAKAREKFQTSSHFGYLDAQSVGGEAKKEAKNAIGAQKAHMKEVIDKLKSQTAQLWEDGGDFDKYEVKKYAPTELETALKHAREDWKCSEVETYASYKKAQASLRECLRLGYSVIEKSIDPLKKHELWRNIRDGILGAILLGALAGFFLGAIFPGPLIAARGMPDVEAFKHGWLTALWVGTAAGTFIGFVVGLFSAFYPTGGKEAIRDRYERLRTELKNKYTPIC